MINSRLAFALFVAAVPSLALALPVCTTSQVVARICSSRPSDDTGIGKQFGDFGGVRTELSRRGRQVTPEAYARFVKVFKAAARSYLRLSFELSDRDRQWIQSRLAELKLPTRDQLSKNPLMAVLEGANANYSPFSNRISVTPMILNSPKLSSSELLIIVAHELGHYLDPSASKNLLHRAKTRLRYLDPSTPECFTEDFRQGNGSRTHPGIEDFADWMATHVIDDYVTQAPSEELARQRLLTSVYVFCDDEHDWLQKLESILDTHSSGKQRILTFMNSPRELALIGCGSTIVDPRGAELGQCYLSRR
jgi:hypothetical protein